MAVRLYSEGGDIPAKAICDSCIDLAIDRVAIHFDWLDWWEVSRILSYMTVSDPVMLPCEVCESEPLQVIDRRYI